MSTGGSATQPRMRGPERRAHLLGVARTAFLRDGYSATSTSAIAAEAGVSETLVLRHFGSKKTLFREALAAPLVELIRVRIEDTTHATGTRRARDDADSIRVFLLEWAKLVREETPVITALLGNLNDVPEVAADLLAVFRDQVDRLASTIDGLRRRPEYREFNAPMATYASVAAVTVGALTAPDVDAFVEQYVDMLMVGVLSTAGRRQFQAAR